MSEALNDPVQNDLGTVTKENVMIEDTQNQVLAAKPDWVTKFCQNNIRFQNVIFDKHFYSYCVIATLQSRL